MQLQQDYLEAIASQWEGSLPVSDRISSSNINVHFITVQQWEKIKRPASRTYAPFLSHIQNVRPGSQLTRVWWVMCVRSPTHWHIQVVYTYGLHISATVSTAQIWRSCRLCTACMRFTSIIMNQHFWNKLFPILCKWCDSFIEVSIHTHTNTHTQASTPATKNETLNTTSLLQYTRWGQAPYSCYMHRKKPFTCKNTNQWQKK